MTPLLAVRDLTVSYATKFGPLTAARAVSFDLAAGQALGLVGESGSGKSTIAGAILNLLGDGASVSGRILFEGVDLCGLDPKRRRRLLGRRRHRQSSVARPGSALRRTDSAGGRSSRSAAMRGSPAARRSMAGARRGRRAAAAAARR